jgi:flagellar biosynthesis GTPase FlhF
MGANAVIVSTQRSTSATSFLPGFLGGGHHEVIAVADDAAGEQHTITKLLDSDDMRKISGMSAAKLEAMSQDLIALRAELQALTNKDPAQQTPAPTPLPVRPDGNIPAFATQWDPRFLQKILTQQPDFLTLTDRTRQRDIVTAHLPPTQPFQVKKASGPHIVVLTGPTGSGKTTTLAKLATHWSLGLKLKVGIITTDTYRVAAVDHIREYATMLGLELKIAFSASEAAKAIRTFADKDVILVDTTGRSHYDASGLKGLQGMLSSLGPITTLLVVPAPWNGTDVPRLIKNFSMSSPTYLVITKLDETRSYHVLTFAAAESNLPIVFLTDGQRVPQDIRDAKPSDLAAMLVPIEEPEI